MFRLCTGRTPDAEEAAELASAYADHLAMYQADAEAARRAIRVGESEPDASLDPPQLASWTLLANLILNLDEVVTKN